MQYGLQYGILQQLQKELTVKPYALTRQQANRNAKTLTPHEIADLSNLLGTVHTQSPHR